MAHRIQSFRDIASHYDVVLCDVWGVLHNGVEAFSYASEALAEARAAGLTVVLITNSPRPHPGVKVQIRGLGVTDDAYDRRARRKSISSVRTRTCRCSTASASNRSAWKRRASLSVPVFAKTRRKPSRTTVRS
jgi:hypothetical protein